MSSPVSQLTRLRNLIASAPPIQGWAPNGVSGIPVLLSAKAMAKNGSPPRIVMFPTSGKIEVARRLDSAIRDVERIVAVHLWAKDFDQMEELQFRFFQALDYQAVGGVPSNAGAVPGEYWKATEEQWDITEDANRQGEEVYVVLTAIQSFDKLPKTTGTVQSTALSSLSTTLTAALSPASTSATVTSTSGFSTQGSLTVDAEQIFYTGITSTTLTGLVRGANSTTPSAHAVGTSLFQLVAYTPWQQAIIALNPYAWYRMDAVAGDTYIRDRSGNGRDLANSGLLPSQPSLVSGDSTGSSMSMALTGSAFAFGIFNIAQNSDFAIIYVFKHDTTVTCSVAPFDSVGDSFNGPNIGLSATGSATSSILQTTVDNGTSVINGASLPLTPINFVIVNGNLSGTVATQVNGSAYSSGAFAAIQAWTDFAINTQRGAGLIDEVVVLNRKLTGLEITALNALR